MSRLTDEQLWATYEQSIKTTWTSCGDFKQEFTIALRAVADAAVAAYVAEMGEPVAWVTECDYSGELDLDCLCKDLLPNGRLKAGMKLYILPDTDNNKEPTQ